MKNAGGQVLSKVPEVTLMFWIVKILATTLGETGGDALSMSMNLGYAVSSLIFLVIFISAVTVQVRAKAFHPALYWIAIVATTTLGTTVADYVDRSLGIGYLGGTAILVTGLAISLAIWRWFEGSIAVETVATPRVEAFYWVTIMFSQTLGTALGDWVAGANSLGFEGGALIFSAGLAVIVALHFWSRISTVSLFWAAFVLTRPLGATVGDLLDKPVALGGLNFSRFAASAVLIVAMVVLVRLVPQKAGQHPARSEA
ncbi:MAG: hypothetical protein KGQ37_08780 [Hyphomicrobiales bacterium]|nr:hypothetical protein [Hyphomicrobiales bacterium]